MTVNHMPEGFHTVTPYLVVADANAVLQFYTEAFGARELYRLPMGDKVATTAFMIYAPDVDAAFAPPRFVGP